MIVDDPVVTAEYEAIADALRPHAVDDYVELTFPQIVGLVAAAVAPIVDGLCRERDEALDTLALEREEHSLTTNGLVRAANEAVGSVADSMSGRISTLESSVEWWRTNAEMNAARLATLEDLAVQTAARWGHEGGPSPMREALAAAGLI